MILLPNTLPKESRCSGNNPKESPKIKTTIIFLIVAKVKLAKENSLTT